jgi:hypothetical protein
MEIKSLEFLEKKDKEKLEGKEAFFLLWFEIWKMFSME